MLLWRGRDKKRNPYFYRPSGLIAYAGLYGAGKTISITYYVYKLHKQFPDMRIYSTFYIRPSFVPGVLPLESIEQIKEIRDKEGSIIIIDEAQLTFEARDFNSFPWEMLYTLSQTRRMRKLFLIASQNFNHVDKRIRDLTLYTVECRSLFGISFRNRFYTPAEYDKRITGVWEKRPKAIKTFRFIGFPELFNAFDTEVLQDRVKGGTAVREARARDGSR